MNRRGVRGAFVLLMLTAASCGVGPAPSQPSASLSTDAAGLCRDLQELVNGPLNAMPSRPANEFRQSLDALRAATDAIKNDANSTEPRVKILARLYLAGLEQQVTMLQQAGTPAIIHQRGLAPKLTAATLADDIC